MAVDNVVLFLQGRRRLSVTLLHRTELQTLSAPSGKEEEKE